MRYRHAIELASTLLLVGGVVSIYHTHYPCGSQTNMISNWALYNEEKNTQKNEYDVDDEDEHDE